MPAKIKKNDASFEELVRRFSPHIQQKFGRPFRVNRIVVEEASIESITYVAHVTHFEGTISREGSISIRYVSPCDGPYEIDGRTTAAGNRMVDDAWDYGQLMGRVFQDLWVSNSNKSSISSILVFSSPILLQAVFTQQSIKLKFSKSYELSVSKANK